ncbi:hypothetical protein [Nostoc sp. NOS(2021)]|nr:hypothetical protein [Nostoc sp. NOS(2021)]
MVRNSQIEPGRTDFSLRWTKEKVRECDRFCGVSSDERSLSFN